MTWNTVRARWLFSFVACLLGFASIVSPVEATTTRLSVFGPSPKTMATQAAVEAVVDPTGLAIPQSRSRFEIFDYDGMLELFFDYDASGYNAGTQCLDYDGRGWCTGPSTLFSGPRVRGFRVFRGGNDCFQQGRPYVETMGLYYYRARWYSPGMVGFVERDPQGFGDSPNLFQWLTFSPVNFLDPHGLKVIAEGRGKATIRDKEVDLGDAKKVWDDYFSFLNKNSGKAEIKPILQRVLHIVASNMVYRIRLIDNRIALAHGGETHALSETEIAVDFRDKVRLFGKRVLLAHELEHAYQFETGKIAFIRPEATGQWFPLLYDMHDEVEAFETQATIFGAAPPPGQREEAETVREFKRLNSMAEKIEFLRDFGYGQDRDQAQRGYSDVPLFVDLEPGFHSVPYPRPDDPTVVIITIPKPE